MSQQILLYVQLLVAVLLGVVILLQQKGQGLSGAFGGSGGFYSTRRGFEKVIFGTTIALAVLFLGSGIARLLIKDQDAAALPFPPAINENAPSILETIPEPGEVEITTDPADDGAQTKQ